MRKNSKQLYKNKSRNGAQRNDGQTGVPALCLSPPASLTAAKAGVPAKNPSLRYAPFRLLLPCILALLLLTAPFALADEQNGVFKVENDQTVQKTEMVKTIEYRPTTSMYVVRGLVRYSDVEGDAYLEMWNIMPGGNRFFSRALGNAGPVRKIQGSSDWREFALPANLMHLKPESVTLEINVVMPGKGTIELKELTVSELTASDFRALLIAGFGNRMAIIPGVLLVVFLVVAAGIWGALFGCLAGSLVPRGKGRKLLTRMCIISIAVGIISLSFGILALCLGQSYYVWLPFTLFGIIFVFVFSCCFPAIKKQYEQFEQRKMQALDV